MRHVEAHDVGLGEEVVELAVLDAEHSLVLGRQALALRVENAHVERPGPARQGAADAAETEDAERCAADVLAHELLLGPAAAPAPGSDVAVALDDPPPYGEQQRESEVGGGPIDGWACS